MASTELGQVVTGASALAAKGEAGMAIAACQGGWRRHPRTRCAVEGQAPTVAVIEP